MAVVLAQQPAQVTGVDVALQQLGAEEHGDGVGDGDGNGNADKDSDADREIDGDGDWDADRDCDGDCDTDALAAFDGEALPLRDAALAEADRVTERPPVADGDGLAARERDADTDGDADVEAETLAVAAGDSADGDSVVDGVTDDVGKLRVATLRL